MKSFEKMDEEIEAAKRDIAFVHEALLRVIDSFRRRSAFFALIAAGTAAALLTIVALMFDWLITLNAVLIRIDVWVLLFVLLLSLGQLFHLFVLSAVDLAEKEKARYRQILRRLGTLREYKSGTIDEEGIREIYARTANKMRLMRPPTSPAVVWVDWILYLSLSLSIILFGLVFL